MPANYAHYRFGKQLLSGMCPNDRRSIQRFRRLYDMGLHGPDIFFYYNPLMLRVSLNAEETVTVFPALFFYPKAGGRRLKH